LKNKQYEKSNDNNTPDAHRQEETRNQKGKISPLIFNLIIESLQSCFLTRPLSTAHSFNLVNRTKFFQLNL